jgi:phosphomannomutase
MNLAIITVSGVRGIVNKDLGPQDASRLALRLGNYLKSGKVAVASDTRKSAPILKNAVISGLVAAGCTVFDLDYSSTPSVFKEVSVRNLDGGIMVTASHNPPEWNGLKFVIRPGRGIFENELEAIKNSTTETAPRIGRLFSNRPIYLEALKNKAGRDSAKGVKVALDLAGGVGCLFIPSLISSQGCAVHSIHGTPGIFPRIIDPTVDPLTALSNMVVSSSCDVGFAFDCDADRLVIVDAEGKKLNGDITLLTCLKYFLENSRNRTIAISADTTLAVEDLVREYNGNIVRAKVGEANVVRKIIENNCGAGGEGSSGGYIEPGFVMCRDGVYGATTITRMIRSEGSLEEIISQFSVYYQDRGNVRIDRSLGPVILNEIIKSEPGADRTDGVKIFPGGKSWVLIRPSNTENVIRVSAEAKSQQRAKELVTTYSREISEIAGSLEHDAMSWGANDSIDKFT